MSNYTYVFLLPYRDLYIYVFAHMFFIALYMRIYSYIFYMLIYSYVIYSFPFIVTNSRAGKDNQQKNKNGSGS